MSNQPTLPEEKISNNAKIILLSLFGLIGGIIAAGTYVIVTKPDIPVELLTLIFGSAITGAFTLSGTLIQTLWGK